MTIDSRLTHAVATVISEIKGHNYLTKQGFRELHWFSRLVRWLFSWTGWIENATEECAHRTLEQIRGALARVGDVRSLEGRAELITSLYAGPVDLSPLKPAAEKSCAVFERYLIDVLGFQSGTLRPPQKPTPVPVVPPTPVTPFDSSGFPSLRSIDTLEGGLGGSLVVSASVGEDDGGEVAMAAAVDRAAPPLPPPSAAFPPPLAHAASVVTVDMEVEMFKAACPMSDNYVSMIATIINTMHETSLLRLAGKRAELEAIGEQLKEGHLHPLRFLCHILATENLRVKLRDFKDWGWSSKKARWDCFVNDLAVDLMARQAEGDEFMIYLPGFAAMVGMDAGALRIYFTRKDDQRWQQMITFIVDTL